MTRRQEMNESQRRDSWHALLKSEHDEIVNRTGKPVTQEPRQRRTGGGQHDVETQR